MLDCRLALVAVVWMIIPGCGGSRLVQEPPAEKVLQDTEPRAIASLRAAPRIDSINYITEPNGVHVIELAGSGFEDGAVAEVLAANGRLVATVASKGDSYTRAAELPNSIADVGTYELRIKNPNGQLSNSASLSVVLSDQDLSRKDPKRCMADLTGSPMTLYLGGGDAEKLFEQYMTQDADLAGKLPYRMKVKFYEQGDSEGALQVVSLGEFEDLFVESRNDFMERLKRQLRGRNAVLAPALQDDAAREKAHLFRCEAERP